VHSTSRFVKVMQSLSQYNKTALLRSIFHFATIEKLQHSVVFIREQNVDNNMRWALCSMQLLWLPCCLGRDKFPPTETHLLLLGLAGRHSRSSAVTDKQLPGCPPYRPEPLPPHSRTCTVSIPQHVYILPCSHTCAICPILPHVQ